eukprot:2819500-Amphidinium_carterae.4
MTLDLELLPCGVTSTSRLEKGHTVVSRLRKDAIEELMVEETPDLEKFFPRVKYVLKREEEEETPEIQEQDYEKTLDSRISPPSYFQQTTNERSRTRCNGVLQKRGANT